jgi:hypothetical protein
MGLLEYVPAGHSRQVLAPDAGWYFPGLQASHAAPNVPAGHALQAVAPSTGEKAGFGQVVHAVAPVRVLNFPAPHR